MEERERRSSTLKKGESTAPTGGDDWFDASPTPGVKCYTFDALDLEAHQAKSICNPLISVTNLKGETPQGIEIAFKKIDL